MTVTNILAEAVCTCTTTQMSRTWYTLHRYTCNNYITHAQQKTGGETIISIRVIVRKTNTADRRDELLNVACQ